MPASSRCSCCNFFIHPPLTPCSLYTQRWYSDLRGEWLGRRAMQRFALRESGRLALGLLGALLLAAAVSALSLPGSHEGVRGFLSAMASRLLGYGTFDVGSR